MIKHYCDRCGKELEDKERSVANVSLRGAICSGPKNLELCRPCLDNMFGADFIAQCIKEQEEKKQKVAERRAERERAKQKKEEDENDQ